MQNTLTLGIYCGWVDEFKKKTYVNDVVKLFRQRKVEEEKNNKVNMVNTHWRKSRRPTNVCNSYVIAYKVYGILLCKLLAITLIRYTFCI